MPDRVCSRRRQPATGRLAFREAAQLLHGKIAKLNDLASAPHVLGDEPDLVRREHPAQVAHVHADPVVRALPVPCAARLHQAEKRRLERERYPRSGLRFAEMALAMAGGHVRNRDVLHRATTSMRPMVGISENTWNVTQKNLGPLPAAAAPALIYDKYDQGEIKSPSGYLRGIVAKALDGELHLERSFYGRMSERRV